MRTIPLKKEERVSYQKKDSIRKWVKKTEQKFDTLSRNSQVGGTVLMGGNVRLKQGVWLRVDGLLKAVPEYNFVDDYQYRYFCFYSNDLWLCIFQGKVSVKGNFISLCSGGHDDSF